MILFKINSKGFTDTMARLRERAIKKRPLMREIGGIMHDEVEENFDAQGRPAWKDLKDTTKAKRAAIGKWPGKILQVSGQLVNSIQVTTTENSAIVGTNKIYGPTHEFGDSRRKIPARPFLTLSNGSIKEIEDSVTRYLLGNQ